MGLIQELFGANRHRSCPKKLTHFKSKLRDPKSDLAGFYLAIGTSGNQFKTAPVVGRLMAELIEVCENGYDHDREPLELTGPYTGHALNAGFYSRLRELHMDSSFSVVG